MSNESGLKMTACSVLPEDAHEDTIYRLEPVRTDPTYYKERTDRNIGWITQEEQAMLKHSVIGIAGCGGMGGLLTSIFVRLGVGEVRIADCEAFDVSNINRQFAAGRETLGKSKAFETARMVRAVSDDTTLVVFPQGINEETVVPFLEGCDIICDEIEFWAVGSRILLHQEARALGLSVFNCNTVGFGTRLFRYDPEGYTVEETVGLSLCDGYALQRGIQGKTASAEEVQRLMERMLAGFVPELPEYGADSSGKRILEGVLDRLLKEQRAPIIATNPPLASGFLADHVLLYLLRHSSVQREIATIPPAPGYFYFDAALMQARIVKRTEVIHG